MLEGKLEFRKCSCREILWDLRTDKLCRRKVPQCSWLAWIHSEQKIVENSNSNLYNNPSAALWNAFLLYRIKYSKVPPFSNSLCIQQSNAYCLLPESNCVPLLCLTLKAECKSLAKIICPCISRRSYCMLWERCSSQLPIVSWKEGQGIQVPFEFGEQDLIVLLGAPHLVSVLLLALPLLYDRILWDFLTWSMTWCHCFL